MTPSLIALALIAFEAELERQTAELAGPLRDVCRYATAGGRRTRARLLLDAVPHADARAITAALALELLHAATLLQDDIFDAGDLRRGRPAAHRCFGKPLTILASDWLLLRALELAAEVDTVFFRCLARAGTTMVQAEAREFTPCAPRSLADAHRDGNAIARGKTAVLFGTTLCGAAVLQGATPEARARWEQLGVELGMTYQLVDDCVDLYGLEATAGKTLGHDLLAGCLTLPVLLAAGSLAERGSPFSLDDLQALQAGCLALPALARLDAEVRSPRVLAEVHHLLQTRFATHREEAADLHLPPAALDAWQADLTGRLEPCFHALRAPANEPPPAHNPALLQTHI